MVTMIQNYNQFGPDTRFYCCTMRAAPKKTGIQQSDNNFHPHYSNANSNNNNNNNMSLFV